VKEGAKLSDWQRGLTEISVWYQAVGDRRPRALDLRLQRREASSRVSDARERITRLA
jgi:hypothetical protein